jgi:hypothetical protein
MKNIARIALAVILSVGISGAPALAQITSNNATVGLSMQINETLTVTATPANITFNYASGSATASGPIQIATAYNLSTTRTLAVMAYFSSTTALTGGSGVMVSNVYASSNGGSSQPCTGTFTNQVPASTPGATCFVNDAQSVSGSGTEIDSLVLSLQSLSGTPGTYTGVLNISAYAE